MKVSKCVEKNNGTPGAIRTPDPQIRSLVLYPAELRVPAFIEGGHIQRGIGGCKPVCHPTVIPVQCPI